MKVSLNEIRQIFDDLVIEKISREHAASWAVALLEPHDRGELEFDPSTEKKKIWRAIVYLTGVDLIKDLEGNYLHSIEDFIDFRTEMGV